MVNKKMVRKSQQRPNKGKSCLNNLFAFQEAATSSVHKGRAANVVYLDFTMVFSTVCHNNPRASLGRYGLHQLATGWWLKNRADHPAPRVKIGSTKSNWQPRSRGIPQRMMAWPVVLDVIINDLDGGRVQSQQIGVRYQTGSSQYPGGGCYSEEPV